MDIGIFTIAYNEYGRYIPAWCKSISESTIQPSQATVALFGNDHGLSDKMAKKCQEILPCLNIVHCGDHVNIGSDRNKAIENTNTEWLMLLSADDVLLPNALEEIAKRDNPDIEAIAVAYIEERVNLTKRYWHVPRTFKKGAMLNWRDYWLSPYSPFRRSFWEKHPYADCEYPNYLQTFAFAKAGVKFARVDKPCVRYVRRYPSHSNGRTSHEHAGIIKMLDDAAGTYESEAIKYRLDILNRNMGEEVNDIYQDRYIKHQKAKKNMTATEAKPEYTDLEIMTIFKVMHERRSQRLFNGEDIDTDRLKGIMKAAELSPSSCNRKAVSAELIKSKHDISLLSKLLVGGSGWLENANAVVLLMADMRAYKSPAEVGFMPFLDAGVIAQNVYLIGEALGVGVCFVNPNIREDNKEEFDSAFVPDGHQFCGALALGSYDLREAKHA